MQCPFCRYEETKVVDSRASQPSAIRRRRECLSCERRFTTYEKIEESPLRVIKKDGSRVPFDRERIRAGLEKACYKRPVSDEQIEGEGDNLYDHDPLQAGRWDDRRRAYHHHRADRAGAGV